MKTLQKVAGTIGALAVTAYTTAAHAALDAGIGTAVTGAKTDGLELIGMLAAAGAAVLVIHKLLKRFGVSL